MEWQLLLESLGPTGPAFSSFLGNSKQEEAFMGTCCILPTWVVLSAMNTVFPAALKVGVTKVTCPESGSL